MFFLCFEGAHVVFTSILGISNVITTVTSINSLISDSSCIYFFYQPLSRLTQTELSLINIDYDLNPLIHNTKKWQNLTTELQTSQEEFSVFMIQIVLVCVTSFG